MSSFNENLIADFRAHGGKIGSGPFAGRSLLLLTTTGAKSGVPRTSPLAYSRDGEHHVVAASKGGAPTHPGWYHNLLADPTVTVEVGTETFRARARPVKGGDERRRLYDAHAERMPVFKGYETKTTRVIPVVVLERIA